MTCRLFAAGFAALTALAAAAQLPTQTVPGFRPPWGTSSSASAVANSATIASFAVTAAQAAALGNGVSKPLSNYYSTVAQAQAAYPMAHAWVTAKGYAAIALTDQLEWIVLQEATLRRRFGTNSSTFGYGANDPNGGVLIDGRGGNYRINRTVHVPAWVSIQGDGAQATTFTVTSPVTAFALDDAGVTETAQFFRDFFIDMRSMGGCGSLPTGIDGAYNNLGKTRVIVNNLRIFGIAGCTIGVRMGSYSNNVEDNGIYSHKIGVWLSATSVSGSNATEVSGNHMNVFSDGCASTSTCASNPSGNTTANVPTEIKEWTDATKTLGGVGILVTGGSSHSTTGVQITNNSIDAAEVAIWIPDDLGVVQDVWIAGNRSEDNWRFLVVDDANGISVTNNGVMGRTTISESPYLIVTKANQLIVHSNNFFNYGTGAVRREFNARNDFIGLNQKIGVHPIVSDNNVSSPYQRWSLFDTFGIRTKRYSSSAAPSHSAGNYATSTFGATGSIVVNNANDSAGRVTVTAAGGGCASTPSFTLTFSNPFDSAPRAFIVQRGGSSGVGTASVKFQPFITSLSGTAVQVRIVDTTGAGDALPCAGETLAMQFWVIE